MNLQRLFLFLSLGLGVATGFAAGSVPADYQPEAGRLTQAATNSVFGFSRLATLCDTFGPRFTGSKNLESAIDWCLAEMKKDGLLNGIMLLETFGERKLRCRTGFAAGSRLS